MQIKKSITTERTAVLVICENKKPARSYGVGSSSVLGSSDKIMIEDNNVIE